jgi:hypothetical protein
MLPLSNARQDFAWFRERLNIEVCGMIFFKVVPVFWEIVYKSNGVF